MSKLKEAAPEAANALARQALEKIKEIDRRASEQKGEQLDGLKKAREAIRQRIGELERQENEINNAMRAITGTSESSKTRERRPRTDMSDVRERVVRWLQLHKDQRYSSRQLQVEFPELQNLPSFAAFLKPAIEEGKIDKQGVLAGMTYAAL